jgi:hypothetical protein
MGLDMYLSAKKHFYSEDGNAFADLLKAANLEQSDVDEGFSSSVVSFKMGYWRKANAIHGWLIKNVQSGKDDCGEYYVSIKNLETLKLACLEVLKDHKKAETLLPPTYGFFFGSTELDDGYLDDLEKTVEIINRCLGPKFKDWNFYYQASW